MTLLLGGGGGWGILQSAHLVGNYSYLQFHNLCTFTETGRIAQQKQRNCTEIAVTFVILLSFCPLSQEPCEVFGTIQQRRRPKKDKAFQQMK